LLVYPERKKDTKGGNYERGNEHQRCKHTLLRRAVRRCPFIGKRVEGEKSIVRCEQAFPLGKALP